MGLVVLVGPCLGGRSFPNNIAGAFFLVTKYHVINMFLLLWEAFGDENN